MENPTMLYRHPGAHEIHGGKFDYTIVEDADVEATLADGWYRTTTEAKDASEAAERKAAEQQESEAEDKAAATRDEIEQKLNELKVTFDRRLGTPKLLKLLDDTLKARAGAAG